MSDGFENLPKMGAILTLKELEMLDLPDSPCLEFRFKGIVGWVQNSHITQEDFLSNENFNSTKWRYQYTTREWIPVFIYVDDRPINQFLDLELMDREKNYTPDEDPDTWWATPKGFPREQ